MSSDDVVAPGQTPHNFSSGHNSSEEKKQKEGKPSPQSPSCQPFTGRPRSSERTKQYSAQEQSSGKNRKHSSAARARSSKKPPRIAKGPQIWQKKTSETVLPAVTKPVKDKSGLKLPPKIPKQPSEERKSEMGMRYN